MFVHKDYVIAIAEAGSFSLAAERLYLSQPSLSAIIRRLEEKIGAPLFDRTTHPITLTQTGEAYILAAREIMTAEENFSRYLFTTTHNYTGHIRIGGSNLFCSYILPDLISRFNHRYPQVEFEIIEGKSTDLLGKLLRGELDAIVDNSEPTDERLTSRRFFVENLLLAVPADLPVNRKLRSYAMTAYDIKRGANRQLRAADFAQFRDETFILLRPENDTGKRALRLCEGCGFTPHTVFRVDQQLTAYNIAASGLGIALVSDTLVCHAAPQETLLYYRINDDSMQRSINFYQKKSTHSDVLSCFLDYAAEGSRN